MGKLVCGVGINDGLPFKEDPQSYRKWAGMLQRQTQKYWDEFPTYTGTVVCEEWKIRSGFHSWLIEHENWENLQLDKDLLGGGLVYSPETCVLLTNRMNSVLALPAVGRGKGDCPHGVHFNTNRQIYIAAISNRRLSNHRVRLGEGQDAAYLHSLWQEAKIGQIRDAMSEWNAPLRVRDAVEVVIQNLKYQIAAGEETYILNAIPLFR